jgi:chromosome segregation ATPase
LLDNLQDLQEVHFILNTCIDKMAKNSSEIQALIEVLRVNCTDIEPETTTQLTTTNQPPRCEIEDLEDFVCGLDEEIEYLREKVETLKVKNEILEQKVKTQDETLEAHSDALVQLELKYLELSSRPCGC